MSKKLITKTPILLLLMILTICLATACDSSARKSSTRQRQNTRLLDIKNVFAQKVDSYMDYTSDDTHQIYYVYALVNNIGESNIDKRYTSVFFRGVNGSSHEIEEGYNTQIIDNRMIPVNMEAYVDTYLYLPVEETQIKVSNYMLPDISDHEETIYEIADILVEE